MAFSSEFWTNQLASTLGHFPHIQQLAYLGINYNPTLVLDILATSHALTDLFRHLDKEIQALS